MEALPHLYLSDQQCKTANGIATSCSCFPATYQGPGFQLWYCGLSDNAPSGQAATHVATAIHNSLSLDESRLW